MSYSHPLDSVTFISADSVSHEFLHALGDFVLDPDITLPVQKDSPDQISDTNTPEMILAGILSLFAYDAANRNARYYKNILLRVRPGIRRELAEAAMLNARNENFEIAEEICLVLSGLDPDDAATALTPALVLDQKGEFYRKAGLHDDADACDDEALMFYKKAMQEDIPDAYFNAAVFFLRKQNFVQAKDCFESYLALVQGLSEETLGENGLIKIEHAVQCINMIDAQNLDDAQFKKAYTLISTGEEEKGILAIKTFLESHPTVWNAWFLLGWGLRLSARYVDARQAFLQAAACEGGSTADTFNELAICCMELGLFAESESYLNKALKLNPEDAKIMSNIGVLMLRQSKAEAAKLWFLTALEYNPDDVIAKTALENLPQ
jgi:tetratricopeptide (TPR) repeat protein